VAGCWPPPARTHQPALIDAERVGLSLDETSTQATSKPCGRCSPRQALPDFAALAADAGDRLPAALLRQSAILSTRCSTAITRKPS
jgi:hypothetical protein